MNNNKITLLSSCAVDSVVDEEGNLISKQEGGPAYFIKMALDKEKFEYTVPYLNNFDVEILITSKGEFGKINSKVEPKKIRWQKIKTPILISTILDEFILENIEGQIFIDIQGYVRDGNKFGKKKFWKIDDDMFFCVKGTEEELSYLPTDSVEKQKQKMLLVTTGKKGSIIYFNGRVVRTKPNKIVNVNNTVGAGDTLFAYFVARYLKTNRPKQSLEYATRKTEAFLSTKNHHADPF